ncbi:MAG: lytic transglycosylase domain-containing protein [Proteobacteria bacterium]|nr:lytic transglycosylase domain-containing protein [Pseudomonadota bacterium]
MVIPYYACMVAAASAYHLPVHALPAIQAAEGGYIGAVRPNTDGSHDLGLMQVNTRWIGPLAQSMNLSPRTVTVRLILSPCFNIAAAAAILRGYIAETHGNVWKAIGDYHSHTPGLNTAYRFRVLEEALRLPPVKAASAKLAPGKLAPAKSWHHRSRPPARRSIPPPTAGDRR